jgi:hypothetical protein
MRFIALLLLLVMCFTLAACPKKTDGSTDKEKTPAGQDKSAGEEGGWENTE